jgi:hypothetical protein
MNPPIPRSGTRSPNVASLRRRRIALVLSGATLAVLFVLCAALAFVVHRVGGRARFLHVVTARVLRRVGSHLPPAMQARLLAATSGTDEPVERAAAPIPVYAHGTLSPGWVDWSWATHDLAARDGADGRPHLRMVAQSWKGVYLHHDPFGTDGYGSLQIAVCGRTAALQVTIATASGSFGVPVPLPANTGDGWTTRTIPLASFGVPRSGGTIAGVVVQDASGGADPQTALLDDIALLPDPSLPLPPTRATIAVSVDTQSDRHPISPLIYGLAFAPADYLHDLRVPINRWGGNDKSRYNWYFGNAENAARDWRFANRVATSDARVGNTPSSAADAFVQTNRASGADSLLTIPTIGWVAKNSDNNCASDNVPGSGGAPLTTADGAIAGYDPAANRAKTSVPSIAREADASASAVASGSVVAQDDWVGHLVLTFGPAAHRGVRFYAMDNEPDLWDVTHTDVHPARMGYDDVLANFTSYADAVKTADPSALVTGPVVSGWTAYQFSSLDRGDDNFHTHADRARHDDMPFLLWFLQSVRAHDERAGHRTLDVLDIHYYPQASGVYSPAADPGTQRLRLRTTRSLWDPSYADESWIGEPVRLVPRLREWVDAGYPGTKIGITEWSFGGDNDISGGLAITDALGIYGREGVYLANYWAYSAKNSPGYLAFKLLRNPDGAGHGLGDLSCRAVSADPTRLSAYAALDGHTLTLLLVNKMPMATVTVPLSLPGDAARAGDLYRLSAASPNTLVHAPFRAASGGNATIDLPPYSATLLRLGASSGR